MTTERHAWLSLHDAPAWAGTGELETVCGCGQDLDLTQSTHCPRCGVGTAQLRYRTAA